MTDEIELQLEQTGLPEMPEMGRLQIRNAQNPMQTEVHPNRVEFLLLCSGCKRMWLRDRCYDLQGGDLLIILPGEEHGAEDFIQNRSSLLYLMMTVPTEGDGFCMLSESERQALWERICGLPARLQAPSPVRRGMERLFAALHPEDSLRAARLRVRLMEFLFQLLDAGEALGGRLPNPLPADISTVIRYIRERRDEMPDIPRLASLVNLSESRFKQKFKQATGIPPAEFIVREKIREAGLLLRDNGRTVTSIAMELGFSSSQHFSVLFKKYVGESPVQYRKNHEFVP